ncbi:beta-galactosidase family protein [Siphonobacter sp. SORGH_AS_1065]|uniref:glycoside hydrolase family 35 protein n=1 Tax=Siphonobacter sp. SORGH_AS_1065 TaxID=3041795 RepID=UPI002784C0EF|nr:beta-galactosidase family protein [Siphonobacter sp. SORGH_AS_1065]MDQ1089685.1 beta-galactosidase [Siphonobacter sp. SORGH_AS_1065]
MNHFCLRVFLCITVLFYGLQLQAQKHTFTLGQEHFLLDGKPFHMISGEMHPARIPKEYWKHRIQMAKAMGCNTIAAYVFWNYHEQTPGHFDFRTDNRNIAEFIKLAQQEGLWVLLRPGPYVCAEWDFGGIPPYLLAQPDLKVRCMDPTYLKAAERYIKALSKEVNHLQVTQGGPILMVQAENEYGSFGNDRQYMQTVQKLWLKNGINVPFYTADGPATANLKAGSLPGAATGLDPGASQADFDLARKMNPGVPVFSAETYPGWLTHWGEKWARPDTTSLLKEVRFLLKNKLSFNLYVIHGGTNFGFTAGANAFKPTEYQPDLTSYDYDAPVNEQGRPTPKYYALRQAIQQATGHTPPALPEAIPAMEIPAIHLNAYGSVWNNLPPAKRVAQPKPMEAFGQNSGFILYRTKLNAHTSGKLLITELHDYATVFVDGKYVGHVYRDEGNHTITLPKTDSKEPILDILVEGMGRINFAEFMIDRKGITERVSLNGMTLMDWQVYNLPFTTDYIQSLKSSAEVAGQPGRFFKGTFELSETADTFFDLSTYKKGVIYINGHNLGRYWERGPQTRLYCPASWLKKGTNEVLIFDQHQLEAATISGKKTLE